jgi:hypothetical protein
MIYDVQQLNVGSLLSPEKIPLHKEASAYMITVKGNKRSRVKEGK